MIFFIKIEIENKQKQCILGERRKRHSGRLCVAHHIKISFIIRIRRSAQTRAQNWKCSLWFTSICEPKYDWYAIDNAFKSIQLDLVSNFLFSCHRDFMALLRNILTTYLSLNSLQASFVFPVTYFWCKNKCFYLLSRIIKSWKYNMSNEKIDINTFSEVYAIPVLRAITRLTVYRPLCILWHNPGNFKI